MLMRSHGGRVNEQRAHRLVVKVLEMLPDSFPKPGSFPASKAMINGHPFAKLSGHIALRVSGAGLEEEGFHEHSIAVFWRCLLFSFDFENQGINGFLKSVANTQTTG